MSKKGKLKVINPAFCYARRLKTFFASDSEVEVGEMNKDTNEVVVTVREIYKFGVLSNLLGGVHEDSGLMWVVTVKLADPFTVNPTPLRGWEAAFHGNKNFVKIIRVPSALTDVDVVVVKPVVAQTPVDEMFNPYNGLETLTYQELAALIFSKGGNQTVFTSSPLEENKKK